MSTPTVLDLRKSTTRKLFPWMQHVSVSKATGALVLSAATKLIELVGGGGRVIRDVDKGGRFIFDPGIPGTSPPALYYSPALDAVFEPVAETLAGATAGGSVPTLPAGSPGTSIVLGPGSARVTCG